MSKPLILYRLQQVDSQLDEIHARLEEIEAALKDDRELRDASQRQEEAQEKAADAQSELRKAEAQVVDQQAKIRQNQQALYGGKVTNPKELQDLQQESEALQRYLGTLEDRQLECMIAVEEAEAQHQAAIAAHQEAQRQGQHTHAELTAERAELQKKAERLRGQRQAEVSNVAAEDLQLYEELRQSRGGLAVAKVVDKACSACGTILSQALAQAARSPQQINRCDTCQRILYAD
jgi:predicted  nucleic acid-binding Zn-ribbon protein